MNWLLHPLGLTVSTLLDTSEDIHGHTQDSLLVHPSYHWNKVPIWDMWQTYSRGYRVGCCIHNPQIILSSVTCVIEVWWKEVVERIHVYKISQYHMACFPFINLIKERRRGLLRNIQRKRAYKFKCQSWHSTTKVGCDSPEEFSKYSGLFQEWFKLLNGWMLSIPICMHPRLCLICAFIWWVIIMQWAMGEKRILLARKYFTDRMIWNRRCF